MGKVVLILAVISSGLALTSLHLVKQLRDGDATIAELQSQVASLQEQKAPARPLATFSPAPAPVPLQAIEPAGAVISAPPKEAPKPAQAQSGNVLAAMVPAPPTREESMRMMREHRERQRQLMQDPEYRDAMRVQARSSIVRQYPGVVQELGLDAQQAESFFDMLADQQMQLNEQMEPMWEADGVENRDPAATQARHRRIHQAAIDRQRKNEAELASRFGQDKLQVWKEYQSTIGQRYQLEHMRTSLAAQGLSLSDDVSKPMLKALAAAQKAEMQEHAAAASSRGWTPVLSGRLVAFDGSGGGLNMEQQIATTRKRNQRMLDAVSPYLTFEQRAAIEKEHEAQVKMLEAQDRIMRARGDANANGTIYNDSNSAQFFVVPQ